MKTPKPTVKAGLAATGGAMRIVFLCAPAGKINGGIKYTFRMAEILRRDGFEAVVFEKDGIRPAWFDSSAPIIGTDDLRPQPGETLVLPEDQPDLLKHLADWPQRKVIYCQNPFYAAFSALGCKSYADYGISALLCGSLSSMVYAAQRHQDVPRYHVPCGVDSTLFMPRSPKRAAIALLPRKRPVEAAYLQDMFRAQYPQWQHVAWQEIGAAHEQDVAAALGEAAVFLALSRLDGFGLTPLEAMAAGCVVAGFTGIGGREYATEQNGFWAAEDDFPACLQGLNQALTLWHQGGTALADHLAAGQATAARYTPEHFAAATRQAWTSLLHG